MKNMIKVVVLMAAMLVAGIGYSQDSWVFGLGGSGATSTKSSGGSGFGIGFDLGRTGNLLLPIQTGVRQGLTYANSDANGSQTLLNTALYNDWTVFTHKALEVFVGANVAATYGNTKPLFTIAPEAGVRLAVKKDVNLVGRVQYGFDLNDHARQQDYISYEVGIQFKF